MCFHGDRLRNRSVGGNGVCVIQGEIHLPPEPGHVCEPRARGPSAHPEPQRLLSQRLEEQQQPALLLQGSYSRFQVVIAPFCVKYANDTFEKDPMTSKEDLFWTVPHHHVFILRVQVFHSSQPEQKLSWLQAHLFCQRHGANLLSIGSPDEEHFVLQVLHEAFGWVYTAHQVILCVVMTTTTVV